MRHGLLWGRAFVCHTVCMPMYAGLVKSNPAHDNVNPGAVPCYMYYYGMEA